MQATEQLLTALPSYADLTSLAAPLSGSQHDAAHEVKRGALWTYDTILAARVQFLLSVVGPCLPALEQVRLPASSSHA